jgi:hypothetical protein
MVAKQRNRGGTVFTLQKLRVSVIPPVQFQLPTRKINHKPVEQRAIQLVSYVRQEMLVHTRILQTSYELKFLYKMGINWVRNGTANEHETYKVYSIGCFKYSC